MQSGPERRLTTILAADVAGYSRLMEADEEGTFAALRADLDTRLRPRIEERRGRIVKLMGDGVLAEFPSVVDAVACAEELQQPVPDEARLALRIGIHIGDVISEGGDLHGTGVNIAARLEALAEPGSICISKAVHDQLAERSGGAWLDLGEVQVKNIARPVHAFRLDPGGKAAAPPMRRRGAARLGAALAALFLGAAVLFWQAWEPGQRADAPAAERDLGGLPSLAVLPFRSLSPEAEQDYLADGITVDLTTDLAMVSGLVVIASDSAFAYRQGSAGVAEISDALGARYLVQGSVRRAGGRIRINAQLVDATTGAHVWAERYDRAEGDIFEMQDDVRSRIVSALQVELTPSETQNLTGSPTSSPDAYDRFLQARQQEAYFTKDSIAAAIRLYREALELDPGFSAAKARLANVMTLQAETGGSPDPEATLREAFELAEAVVAEDPDLPLAYWTLSRVLTRPQFFDLDRAIETLRQAIEIDPNYADGHAYLAQILHFAGRAETGLSHIETAMRLNPRTPFWYIHALGANQFQLTRYEAARESFEKAIEQNPHWRPPHEYLVATYGHLGLTDEAEWEMEELRSLGFEPVIADWQELERFEDEAFRERYLDGLRKAGVPEA